MKRILVTFFLLIACGIASAQSLYKEAEPLSVWEKSRQIQREYIERLKERLADDPDNLALKQDLGRAYHWLALEREEVAIIEGEKLFAKIIKQDPENAVALAYHGSFMGFKLGHGLVSGDEVSAIGMRVFKELDQAVELAPDSIEVRYVRGYSSFYTPSVAGRDHIAIEDFKHAIKLLDRFSDTERRRGELYMILGDACRKTGDSVNARANWERAKQMLSGTSLELSAETRLFSQNERDRAAALNVKKLSALLGFLIGAIIFMVLTALVLRDLFRMRRRRGGMVASLFVSLAAMLWNGMNLILAAHHIIGFAPTLKAWEVISWDQHILYLILALSPIPFGLVIAYRFYKATFMDIVLKRGVALLAVFALSMIYARLLEYPMALTALHVTGGTLRAIFFAGMWLWVYLLYPPLRDRIYSLVDRYVFKRRDYSRLLDWFNDRLRTVTDEASLITVTTDGLKEAFAAEQVGFVPSSEELAIRISTALAGWKSDIALRDHLIDEGLETDLEKQGVELMMVIRTGKELEGIILIGPRAFGQGYLSEELSVLRAVVGQVERTMENLRLHEARRKHALMEEALRKLAAQAELKALRAQIDPHFLFNALNSVASLIGDDPEAAEELTEDIADLFRHSFKTSREFSTLGQEIELVETYLRVERARLGDKLRFTKSISPDALSVKIPSLSIQPLIENSIRHGIGRSNNGGSVTLWATIRKDSLNVAVADTGAGISPSEMRDIYLRGVGLANVNDRLTGLYGREARLRIDSCTGQGTTVSFSVPLRDSEVEASLELA